MSFKELNCKVEMGEDPFGQFSNALRLSVDGSEALLDFCLYSEKEGKAKVVSRVRVSMDFLPIISEKITKSFAPNQSFLILTNQSESVESN